MTMAIGDEKLAACFLRGHKVGILATNHIPSQCPPGQLGPSPPRSSNVAVAAPYKRKKKRRRCRQSTPPAGFVLGTRATPASDIQKRTSCLLACISLSSSLSLCNHPRSDYQRTIHQSDSFPCPNVVPQLRILPRPALLCRVRQPINTSLALPNTSFLVTAADLFVSSLRKRKTVVSTQSYIAGIGLTKIQRRVLSSPMLWLRST